MNLAVIHYASDTDPGRPPTSKIWFKDARARDIPITGPLLEEKARDLATHLDVPDFNPSNGWLCRWKTRNSISFKRLHGEKKDADSPAADHWVNDVLPGILADYAPKNIYNADETGIYYRALPDGTLAMKTEHLFQQHTRQTKMRG